MKGNNGKGRECKWRQAKIDSVPQDNSPFTPPPTTQTITINVLHVMYILLHWKCWCKWSLLLLDVSVSESILVLWSTTYTLQLRKFFLIEEEVFYLGVKIFLLGLLLSAEKWSVGALYTKRSGCCKRWPKPTCSCPWGVLCSISPFAGPKIDHLLLY